jgi:hypothetical protein
VKHAFKNLGASALGIAIVLGLSYSAELPKYRFQEDAAATGRVIPGARLVNAVQSTELASPVSWFWPATTTWNFAWPDLAKQNRFYAVTLVYGQDDPVVLLVDADCKTGAVELYDLDEPDSALPALTIRGEPVVAPNGKTYRRTNAGRPFPSTWIESFCGTDWTAEKASVAAERQPSEGGGSQ